MGKCTSTSGHIPSVIHWSIHIEIEVEDFKVLYCQLVLMSTACHMHVAQRVVEHSRLECGPMPNVMAALPNIGGTLCSMLQSAVQ